VGAREFIAAVFLLAALAGDCLAVQELLGLLVRLLGPGAIALPAGIGNGIRPDQRPGQGDI
jgi:hypothetical protein